jgi:hypothetical protein
MNATNSIKHIDIYIFMEYGHKISPLVSQAGVAELINEAYNLPDSMKRDIDSYRVFFRLNPPKTKFLVHRLKEMGFAPHTISLWLDINATSVSYHLKRKLESEYICPKFKQYLINAQNVFHDSPITF